MSEFRHLHAAHCESGVTASLLRHQGLELSEPMVFGLGSGIFFFFPPLIKVMGMPLISFRSYPGNIFKLACRRLGVKFERKTFRSSTRGKAELDDLLAREIPVGIQTNMFWLSYFPSEFRSQFNGHNLIALERGGDDFLLSDPMLEETVRLDADALERARFAKGVLAPKGALYYPTEVPSEPDLVGAVKKGVNSAARRMLDPVPVIGVRGIRRMARAVRSWKSKEARKQKLMLGHIIRMQEEVGSGGAGFRFMYAAFLQEAGELLGHKPWLEASERMTEAGDCWRSNFAGTCGRIIKGRGTGDLDTVADALVECARLEEELYRFLLAYAPSKSVHSLATGTAAAAR